MHENNSDTVRTKNTGADTDVASAYLEQNRTPQVRNADNEWLGSPFPIAAVEEVNGQGAAEVSGFVPTRHELLELAKYWTNVAVNIEYSWFLSECVGSSETRRQSFAWRRVGRIRELLGDRVSKVVDEVYEECGKKQEPRYWEVFLNGTAGQREAIQEELQRTLEERDGNQNGRQ